MNNYFLGLDLGTASIGWAVTDNKYEIVRAHGKSLWGVRLFESAKTAEERRTFRTSRRRLARRNWRIELLRMIFAEEIEKIDDGFFLRMKESRYVPEDKRDSEGRCPELPYSLFIDSDYTDKEYYKQFPTIYHLRKWLMHTDKTPDIRLVYLAIHHFMKHRGHFLFSGSIENVKDFKYTFMQFISKIKDEELDFSLDIEDDKLGQVEEILKNKNNTKTAKKTKLIKLLGAKTLCEKAILNIIAGGKVKLSDIFSDKELDNCDKPKIAFSDNSYDEDAAAVENILGEKYVIIEQAKTVYDWAVLADILGDYQSVSEAKTALYEKHHSDLVCLKKLVKDNLEHNDYKKLFVNSEEKVNNYCAYIGMTKVNGKKTALKSKQCSQKEFYDFLKKNVVKKIADSETNNYISKEIEKETFLPRQVSKDNSVIPYQVHLYELNQIIANLEDRIPLLKEYGDKIRQIFTFRLPYYVGPLNGIRKGDNTTNWMVRKCDEKIYPWNFEQIVDIEASAEKFIRRMTNKCTYLVQEDVLPQNSILYSKFVVLNELNNLCLNGEPISVELKQKIYMDLFMHSRRVTQKKLKNYLKTEGIIAAKDINNLEITGIDGDFKGSLTAYHDLKEKLTECKLSDLDKENIILNITLFGEDKKLLGRRLSIMYPKLTEKQIKGLCTLSYKGWGRLSSKFLEGIAALAPGTGEVWSIIQALWETNDNLMQLLSSKYQFADIIAAETETRGADNISFSIVEELAVSPAVKRQIWQTLQIVKELCKVMSGAPERIFVEMAREKQKSARTTSRKQKLVDLYKKCKEEERDWLQELQNTQEHNFRGDKLYLYYTQKGRCMYSGEPIDLQELWDNRKYDIDHIYPQSKVMDDSIDNRVLVKKTYNADKTDIYPIDGKIRENMKSFWKSLLDGDFISKEKYKRLVRATEFEPVELAGFIQRQLVETRQGTKAIASILKQILPDTEIVYVKAKITSQFRQDFKLLKVREMNDLHHAKDAYLNIVVGNVYYTKFTRDPAWFIEKNPGRSYNIKRLFTSDKDIARNGETAWRAGDAGTIGTVRKWIDKNNILVTRRSYKAKGKLFDQQLMKKGKGQVPIKSSDNRLCDIKKYGAYNKASGTYFMLVESEDKKGNKIRTIEFVPLYLCSQIEKNEEYAKQYFIKERALINPQILLPMIKIDTLFKVDGFYMYLSGRTENRLLFKCANQLLLSAEEAAVLKKIIKFVLRRTENKELKLVKNDEIQQDDLIRMYDAFVDKLRNSIYKIKLGAQEKTLTAKRDNFIKLSDEDKCIVLSEILHIFQSNSIFANLKLIGGGDKAGGLKLSKNIKNCKQISIINQSPTGIYEQEIDLKKI